MIEKHLISTIMAAVVALAFILTGCAMQSGRKTASQSQPAGYTAELREVQWRARLIAKKIDDKTPLTAEDWGQARAMIDSGDWRIRTKGLMLLPWFRDAGYTAQIWQIALDHLSDSEPAPRVHAAAALGTIDPAKAAPHIRPLLQDPDPDVRKHVRKILDEIEEATQES